MKMIISSLIRKHSKKNFLLKTENKGATSFLLLIPLISLNSIRHADILFWGFVHLANCLRFWQRTLKFPQHAFFVCGTKFKLKPQFFAVGPIFFAYIAVTKAQRDKHTRITHTPRQPNWQGLKMRRQHNFAEICQMSCLKGDKLFPSFGLTLSVSAPNGIEMFKCPRT